MAVLGEDSRVPLPTRRDLRASPGVYDSAVARPELLDELSGVDLRRSYCQVFEELMGHQQMHEGWSATQLNLADELFADFPPADRSVGDVTLWDARDVAAWADRHADAVGYAWWVRSYRPTPVTHIFEILEYLGDSYDEETRKFLRSLLDDIDEHWRVEHADEAVPGSEYLARVFDQVRRNGL